MCTSSHKSIHKSIEKCRRIAKAEAQAAIAVAHLINMRGDQDFIHSEQQYRQIEQMLIKTADEYIQHKNKEAAYAKRDSA